MKKTNKKTNKKTGISELRELQGGLIWADRTGFVITLGLTDAGLESVGEVNSIEMPTPDAAVEKDEVLLVVDGSYGTLEVKSPAEGVLVEVNESVEQDPRYVNDDPFESGWLVRIKVKKI